MPDWKAIAHAKGFDIPDEQIEIIAPSLDSLDEAFRPLCARLTYDVEPAVPGE